MNQFRHSQKNPPHPIGKIKDFLTLPCFQFIFEMSICEIIWSRDDAILVTKMCIDLIDQTVAAYINNFIFTTTIKVIEPPGIGTI